MYSSLLPCRCGVFPALSSLAPWLLVRCCCHSHPSTPKFPLTFVFPCVLVFLLGAVPTMRWPPSVCCLYNGGCVVLPSCWLVLCKRRGLCLPAITSVLNDSSCVAFFRGLARYVRVRVHRCVHISMDECGRSRRETRARVVYHVCDL